MVTAVKGLPTQQQLLLCAATSLLGADGPPPGISTPATILKSRRSSLGFGSPLSASKQVCPMSWLSCIGPSLHMLGLVYGPAECACGNCSFLLSPHLVSYISEATSTAVLHACCQRCEGLNPFPCRGDCPLARAPYARRGGSTCRGPARCRATAGRPAGDVRATASWASCTPPTLSSARR